MIQGEIYVNETDHNCVFAYRGTTGHYTLHYICVNSYDEVKRYGDGMSTGNLIIRQARLANQEELQRFTRILKENDYHYNKANKKVIRISTGELL